MRIYTLHKPKDPALEVVPVKEGFSWPAFVLSPVWALWHRLWFWAIGFALANVVLGWVLTTAGSNELAQNTASLALALIIGWTANDIRRRSLTKRGFEESAVLVADNKETAIARFSIAAPVATVPRNRAGGPW
jgi:hypothetical protein